MNGYSLRSFLGIVCVASSVAMVSMTFQGNRMSPDQEKTLTGGGRACDGWTSCYACVPPACAPAYSGWTSSYYCSCSGGTTGCARSGNARFCVTDKPGTCTDDSGGAACGGKATTTNLPTTSIGSTTVNQIKTWYCVDASGASTVMGTCVGTGVASASCQQCI